MKNKKLLLVVPFLLMSLAACGTVTPSENKSEPESQQPSETTVAVTGVTLDHETLELGIGETQKLNATVAPANASNTAVTWSSDHEDIASVAPTGLVTANAPGEAVITVTTRDGNFTASCTVTVGAPKYGNEDYPLSVAEALAIAAVECAEDNAYTADYLFIEAYAVTSTGFGNYGSNFMIADSMTAAAADQLLVYSCNYDADLGAFYKGDKVIIKGAIKNYVDSKGNKTLELTNVQDSNKQTIFDYPVCVAIDETRGTSTVTLDSAVKNLTLSNLSAASGTNGQEFTFEAAPAAGYELLEVTVGGRKVTKGTDNLYHGKFGNDPVVSAKAIVEGSQVLNIDLTKQYSGDVLSFSTSEFVYSSQYKNHSLAAGKTSSLTVGGTISEITIIAGTKYDNYTIYSGTDTTGTVVHTGTGKGTLVASGSQWLLNVDGITGTSSLCIKNIHTSDARFLGLQIVYLPTAA